MKKIYCSLIMLALFVTGCANKIQQAEYDSYAVFEVGGDVENDELDDAVRIVENRLNEKISGLDYSFSVDYKSDTFRLDFNCMEKCTEDFIRNLTLCNSVELRRGDSVSDPIAIDKKNIVNAESYFAEDYANWCVLVEFDENGSSLFADVTSELAGTDIPVSIWLNDELVFAPLVSCAITDGKTVITGNFTEQSAEELAEKIQSEFLPYSVSVNEYKLAENYT